MLPTKQNMAKFARELVSLNATDQCDIYNSDFKDIPNVLSEKGIDVPKPNWLVIALKVVCYAIGLILAGYGTINIIVPV